MILEFGDKKFEPDVRMAEDLKPVLKNPEMLESNFPAYYMFRDLYKTPEEKEKILKNDLRYDITVIPPAKIGDEFIKTYGHYHPNANKVSYTEIYEVLEGEAIYILQKRVKEEKEGKHVNSKIEDVIAVFAEKGDKVVIPPDYGHVTVNPSEKTLKMANWVCRSFSSIYEPFKELRGACYYFTLKGWVKNEKYSNIPELKEAKPKIPDWLGISKKEDMYVLVEDIDRLEFLVNPDVVEYDVFDIRC